MKRKPIRRIKKRRSNAGAWLLLLACAIVGGGVWLLSQTVLRPTATLAYGEMSSTHPAEAVIIRAEHMFDAENTANLTYFADEGVLVERGTQIAQVYAPGYSQTEITKLNKTQGDIKKQLLSLLSESYADSQLQRLDAAIESVTRQIRAVVQMRAAGNMLNLKRQLERAMSDKQNYLRQKYPNDSRLEKLYSDEKAQRKRIESWTVPYIADRQGIVSYYTDGYEKALTTDSAPNMTAADIRSVLARTPPEITAAERALSPVCRLVEPRGFYITLISQDKNWHPADGSVCKVSAAVLGDTVFDATVLSSARSGGDLVVRMYVDADVRPVLDIRQATVAVGEPPVYGIRIPVNALYTQDGQMGVVADVNGGVFVPSAVLARDTQWAIIRPDQEGALYEGMRVRRF